MKKMLLSDVVPRVDVRHADIAVSIKEKTVKCQKSNLYLPLLGVQASREIFRVIGYHAPVGCV